MTYSTTTIWAIILILGIGTFLLRFGFLAMIGDRKLPEWMLRHLRYTAVAVLPGLVAPAVLWPSGTGGQTDPARLCAAAVTVAVGMITRNVIAAILAGAVTLYGLLWLLG